MVLIMTGLPLEKAEFTGNCLIAIMNTATEIPYFAKLTLRKY